MKIVSLDPRVTRAEIEEQSDYSVDKGGHFQTFEVFHQTKRGQQHEHVGIVHAPNAPMALLYAKEQYARRGHTANIWVVPSAEVYAVDYQDEDIFETSPEKFHRDPASYKVMDKIKEFKERQ